MSDEEAIASDEVRELLRVARRFKNEMLAPSERVLDALPGSNELYLHPEYIAAHDRALAMGIPTVLLPERLGGLGLRRGFGIGLRIAEELADGAPGFAAQFLTQHLLLSVLMGLGKSSELAEGSIAALSAPNSLESAPVAFGVVQPTGGARRPLGLPGSNLSFRSNHHQSNATGIGEVTAESYGLVLRKVELPNVADADRASHLFLIVGSPEPTSSDVTAFVLDLDDTAGLVRQPSTRRMGLRVHGHADVLLEDVTLTKEQVVLDPPDAGALFEAVLSANAMGLSACSVGLAKASYNFALDYCRTRVQGGKPIIEHQSIAAVLWETAASMRVIRSALREAVREAHGGIPDLQTAMALRTVAADMVIRVTIDMVELLGGYGVTTDYPVEKFYRDACVLTRPIGSIEGVGMDACISLL